MGEAGQMKNAALRAFFDGQAASWDGTVCGEHAVRLAGIVAGLGIGQGCRVLDVGTGTGVLLPILRTVLGGGGLSIGLDISGMMLGEARGKSAGRCRLVQGDVQDTPLADGSVDWVLCNSVFPHFSDVPRALGELFRVLSERGYLVICHTQRRHAINALHRAVGGVVGAHTLPTPGALERLLGAAGFRVVSQEDTAERFVVVAEKAR